MSDQNLQIIVGEGTCGIAAGSKEVIATFMELAPEATVQTVSCVGMCHQEVITEVRNEKGESFMYGYVDKKSVQKILDFHRGEGEIPTEKLISTPEEPDHENKKYLNKQTRIALRNHKV